MIIKGTPININQVIKEINENLGRLRDLLVEASKTEDHLLPDVLMFSPDEWEVIGILITHYDFFQKKLHKCKDEKEELELLQREGSFLGVIRDVSMKFASRLRKEVHKA